MRIFVVAGEKSGDDHAAKVMKAIREQNPAVEFQFWGGDAMAEVAPKGLLRHYKDHSYMGLLEVLKNLPSILRNLKQCKADIDAFHPEVVLLVDYPGFNLKIAKHAKMNGIRTAYFIAPKVWAWKKNRYKIIRKWVDQLMVILPFEKAYFEKLGVEAHYVGNPLLEEVPQAIERGKKVALLPGSRVQELKKMVPLFAQFAQRFPETEMVVGAVRHLDRSLYAELESQPNVQLEFGGMKATLSQAKRAIVTSGTATLETALYGIPLAVVYITSYLTYRVARMVIQIPFISLVNLIMDREVVPELIQEEANLANLASWIEDEDEDARQLKEFQELRQKMEVSEGCSKQVAKLVLNG